MPVTPSAIVGALMDLGMPGDELAAKESLYAAVIQRHVELRGRPPAYAFWVPGRLEVFGKHTDYAGGHTLVSAIPRGFALVATPREDGVVQVADACRGGSVTVAIDGPPTPFTGWRRYADVTVRRLARNFPGAALGCDIVLASDLPRASGMSSSSALVISIASALGRVAELPRHSAWKLNIRNGLDAAGYYACIENGRDFASLTGDAGVGTHGGSEDHAAIVEGRPGHVSAFAFVPARPVGTAKVPAGWRFVIAPSGVAARKTGEALEPYNRLSAGTQLLLDAWNAAGPRSLSLAAALKTGPEAGERLRRLAHRAATAEAPVHWLCERLEHFVREDARAVLALDAFNASDAGALGRLAAESQGDAERLLRNQVPETAALAASARTLGAFAACSFGAGFGGAVWALVNADEAGAFARRWHEAAFVTTAGPPLTDLSGT